MIDAYARDPTAMPPPHLLLARAAMLAAAVVWGSTFVVVQEALRDLPVFHLLTFRFALGALLLVPLVRRSGQRRLLSLASLPVGLSLFAGYALQTAGLLWTTPSRSAFLTGLSVVLVPVFGTLFLSWRPAPGAIAGTAAAATGLYLLYRPVPELAGFGRGDLLSLGCAAAFAAHVLLVERVVRRGGVTALAVQQFVIVALLSSPSLLLQPPTRQELTPTALRAILITGVLATALAFLCQLYAQRRLGAVETAVILALEPVVAAAVSVGVGAEPWSRWTAAGGAMVVAGMLTVQLSGGHGGGRPAAL